MIPTICVLCHQLLFCFGKNVSPADRKILFIDVFCRTESFDSYAIIGGFKYNLRRRCCRFIACLCLSEITEVVPKNGMVPSTDDNDFAKKVGFIFKKRYFSIIGKR